MLGVAGQRRYDGLRHDTPSFAPPIAMCDVKQVAQCPWPHLASTLPPTLSLCCSPSPSPHLQFSAVFPFRSAQQLAQGRGVGAPYLLTYLDTDMLIGRASGTAGTFIFSREQQQPSAGWS